MPQKILVTGTSSGFGRLISETLLKKGHTVVAALREATGKNKARVEDLRRAGARTVEMDVTVDASVAEGVAKAIEQTGGLDVVINNAGIGVLGWQEAFTIDDWRRVFEVNVFGVQRVNRAVLPHMRERRSGLLVHISSLLGRMVIPFYGPYNASKHALEALADNYRVELGAFGIESVLVEPGGYGTDFAARLVRPSDAGRTAAYGERAGAPDQSFAAFAKSFEGPNAPNPQWVADAVAALIDAPRGRRPFRTTVDRLGMGAAVDPYNKLAEEVQRNVYAGFGMSQALSLNT
jgi:NAD(P)-dependent dehydrogenase (short-subunit alcohol dehydrogenase family)